MFENIDIYTYRRSGIGKKRFKQTGHGNGKKGLNIFLARLLQAITPAGLVVFCAGFFLGRAVLLGELVPFAVAFVVAAIRVFGRSGTPAVLAVILGLATVNTGAPLFASLLAVASSLLLVTVVPKEVRRPLLVFPAMVLAATIIVKTSYLAFTGPTPYKYFSVLFEAVFAALLTAVMIYGMTALKEKAGSSRPFTGEEFFCILLVGGGILAGTGDLAFNFVALKDVLSKVAILLAALLGGAGAGAAAGAVVGIIPGLAFTVAPALVGAYSFAGLLAGLCRNFGKAGIATGFLLASIILSIYISEYENVVAVLVETGLAIVLFLLFPAALVKKMGIAMGVEPVEDTSPAVNKEVVKEIFQRKIKDWARVFKELSHTFEQVSTTAGQGREEQNLQKLLNQVGEKVCYDCSFYKTCWEREFYKTYQGLVDLLALIEVYGKISPDSLSSDIKRRCARTKELAITLSCLYESYTLNRYWSRRLIESKEIVADQLKGLSEAMASLPEELEFEAEAGDVAPALRKKLREAGIQAEALSVSYKDDGMPEVYLSHPSCGGGRACHDVIGPLLSSAMGQALNTASASCAFKEGDQSCQLRFYPELQYSLELGVAGMGKNGSLISGDNHAFFCLKGGKFGMVVSDGMGVGPKASLESGATISLLRHLLDSGFGHNLAIKTVNSILILRSPGESFATVDMAVINLYSGQAEFVKIGSETSFLMHSGMVTQIRASTLPVGIIRDIEVVTLGRIMMEGDILVMVTDGILDAYQGAGDREDWLTGILMDVAGMPPQDMAELILKLAQTAAGGVSRVPDDMTVLVAKLDKIR